LIKPYQVFVRPTGIQALPSPVTSIIKQLSWPSGLLGIANYKLKGGMSHSYATKIKASFEALPEKNVQDNATNILL